LWPAPFFCSKICERHQSCFSESSEGGGAEVPFWAPGAVRFRGNSSDRDPYTFAVYFCRQLEPSVESSSCFWFAPKSVSALKFLREAERVLVLRAIFPFLHWVVSRCWGRCLRRLPGLARFPPFCSVVYAIDLGTEPVRPEGTLNHSVPDAAPPRVANSWRFEGSPREVRGGVAPRVAGPRPRSFVHLRQSTGECRVVHLFCTVFWINAGTTRE